MPSADQLMVSLATFAAECRFEELPSATVEATKAATIAAIAGVVSSQHEPRLEASLLGARRALGASEGGKESERPLPFSAFEVGCRVASVDGSPLASGATPLGLLSLATLVGAPQTPILSGGQYLTAAAVGGEVQARLARVVQAQSGVRPRWLPGVLLSYLGVATAASRARRLDQQGIASALGIAVTLASGSRQHLVCAAPLLPLAGGFAALGGTWAALQAASGVDGRYGSLIGEWGLFPLYFGLDDASTATSGLGSDFVVTEVVLPLSPADQLAAYAAAVQALGGERDSSTLSLRLLPETFAHWQSLAPERRAELEGEWARSLGNGVDAPPRPSAGGPAHLELELVTDPHSAGAALWRGGELVAFRPLAPSGVLAAADALAALTRDGRASPERVERLCALLEHLEDLDDVSPLRETLSAVLAA